jgi:DNA primase
LIDVTAALEQLGIEYDEHGVEGLALCPMHAERTGKEDSNPSWWINLESGMHICFSCGYKGNLLQLVCDILGFYIVIGDQKGYDYKAAEGWLASTNEVTIEQLQNKLRRIPEYSKPVPKPLPMSEARLAIFSEPPAEALDSRNITLESAEAYGVLWDEKRKMWILPIRDPHLNKLMGWQEKGTVDRTFFNRPPGLPKSKTLFGIENQNVHTVIVVESPLDCLRLHAAGFAGAVAICGSSPSEEQVKLLRGSDKIILAFDNPNLDKAGLKASNEMMKFGRKYGLNLFFFNYGSSSAKDPGDMTNEEIAWGIENAKSSIYGESAYVYGDTQTISS